MTQQRRPGCCGCLFVVHLVFFFFFKEEEEEYEEAILVVDDDDIATENMAIMMILLRVRVYVRVYLRVDIMEKTIHFPLTTRCFNCARLCQPVKERAL